MTCHQLLLKTCGVPESTIHRCSADDVGRSSAPLLKSRFPRNPRIGSRQGPSVDDLTTALARGLFPNGVEHASSFTMSNVGRSLAVSTSPDKLCTLLKLWEILTPDCPNSVVLREKLVLYSPW